MSTTERIGPGHAERSKPCPPLRYPAPTASALTTCRATCTAIASGVRDAASGRSLYDSLIACPTWPSATRRQELSNHETPPHAPQRPGPRAARPGARSSLAAHAGSVATSAGSQLETTTAAHGRSHTAGSVTKRGKPNVAKPWHYAGASSCHKSGGAARGC
jgi:hypothetical protein